MKLQDMNMDGFDKLILQFKDDVYMPTNEPHGSIEATLSRITLKM